MSDTTVGPVKGMVSAFHRGAVLSRRIGRTAQNAASSSQNLDAQQSAEALKKSLEMSEQRLKDAYAESTKTLGQRFGEGIVNDAAITNRLQALTINLLDQIMSLDEYMDDPDAFDFGSFRYILQESERCCSQALHTLSLSHNAMLQSGFQEVDPPPRADHYYDERTTLSSHCQSARLPTLGAGVSPMAEKGEKGLGITPSSDARPPQIPPRSPDRDIVALDDLITRIRVPERQSTSLATETSYSTFDGETSTKFPLPPVNAWQLAANMSPERHSFKTPSAQTTRRSLMSAEVLPLDLANERNSVPVHRSAEALIRRGHGHGHGHDEREPIDQATLGDEIIAPLIKREDVLHQVNKNVQLLERRKQARLSFQQDLVSLRQSFDWDIADRSPVSPLASFGPGSPAWSAITGTSSSFQTTQNPFEIGLQACEIAMKDQQESSLVYTQRRVESPVSRDSIATTTSMYSTASPPLVFGNLQQHAPETPPGSEGDQSGIEDWGPASRTLNPSDFGRGFDDGLQVVVAPDSGLVPVANWLVSDPGLIPVNVDSEVEGKLVFVQGRDTSITPQASFFKYGGFCEGAKKSRDGDSDALKVIKKPTPVGCNADVFLRCMKCAYEIGWETYENDRVLDKAGIYNIVGGGGIRFRQRFLSKSHVSSKHIHEAAYACIFCIENGMTVASHDATVFFSVSQLLRHIQKHPRPLKEVEGIRVLYSDQPGAIDFDICFKDMEPRIEPSNDLTDKLRARPTAVALVTHRQHEKDYKEKDPDGNKTLQFAAGANIVGVTYPPRFNGQWCCGYHDGEKAHFPASTIQLNRPSKENVPLSSKSPLIAIAKWEHRSKDTSSGWLSFKSNEKITNIGFAYEDFWCWSGMNSKGKYGFFPAAFLEGLVHVNSQRKIDLRDVGSKAVKALSAGAEERWSGTAGLGMWSGISGPVHPANAPRPVRSSKKKKVAADDEVGIEQINDSSPASSRSSIIGGSSFFSRRPFGRRATTASRSSDGNSEAQSPI
ncbi:MAG: hypothetical protein M1818_008314 [Claussenomyces sp. TS43310]|nr:MAG: hypothetical protein M1818_008314 [Claussenomyces sp. TS43310]